MKRIRLASRRRVVGLSQEALAEQLGVDGFAPFRLLLPVLPSESRFLTPGTTCLVHYGQCWPMVRLLGLPWRTNWRRWRCVGAGTVGLDDGAEAGVEDAKRQCPYQLEAESPDFGGVVCADGRRKLEFASSRVVQSCAGYVATAAACRARPRKASCVGDPGSAQ